MTSPNEIRLGTRGSQLALWQSNMVADQFRRAGGPPCRLVVIKTSGDRLQDAPLSEIGGKRLFVKEIEDALLRDEIDLAVHSSKDMPAVLPEGLAIGAVLPRENPLDAIVLPIRLPPDTDTGPSIEGLQARLGRSPAIGTGSVRRIAQLLRLMPHARFTPIRGNLDTRLRKLDEGGYDALVLAAAGLTRLGFAPRITMTLPPALCVPAPGQGIVAVEIRSGDEVLRRALSSIEDAGARAALDAERALVVGLGGGCQTPIGALATPIDAESLELTAVVIALDGSREVRRLLRGARRDAEGLGTRVAAELLSAGAGEILADAQRDQSSVVSHQSRED